MNACNACKFGPTFDILDSLTDDLFSISSAHNKLMDSALEVQHEANKLPANPNIDQDVAHIQNVASESGVVVFGIAENKRAIDQIMDEPECSEEAKRTASNGCPKILAILPLINEMIAECGAYQKGVL